MFFLSFLPNRCCEASFRERESISRLDLSQNFDIKLLNSYLSDDILNYLKVRQKLISLPYERLSELTKLTKGNIQNARLNSLLNNIVSRLEAEGVLFTPEDILINNVPLQIDSPFYEESAGNLHITSLKPYAEYLYFNNLKLIYHKNTLVKLSDTFWRSAQVTKGDRQLELPSATNHISLDGGLMDKAQESWSYNLKSDNKSTFVFQIREWMKAYEEEAMCPVVYKDSLIMRNEHRLFCLDISSGKEIWSLGNADNSGEEFYQTLRNLHQNSSGYELLLDEDTVFTELNGQFVAIKLSNNIPPKLIWKRSLGEYTICTKPINKENTVITGLINKRMELWMCGFNAQNGNLLWSTYIGTSGFLSPVCTISAMGNDRVYIGTNHGVLLCLSPDEGKIIWIRKYAPKKYDEESIVENHYQDALSDKGSIAYDTQFMELGSDGLLYYKPRESDYVYIYNIDGELKEEFLIDSQRYYALRALDGKIYLLEKKQNQHTVENPQLNIIDMESGKSIFKTDIIGSLLKGVHYNNREEMLFEASDRVYFVRSRGNKISLVSLKSPVKGWLLNSWGRFIFTGEDKTLFCLDALDAKNNPYIPKNSKNSEYLQKKEDLKNSFSRAIILKSNTKEEQELISRVSEGLAKGYLSLEEILPLIIKNIQGLKRPAWKAMLNELNNLYGEQAICFHDVKIKFCDFLFETGLIGASHIKRQRYSTKTLNLGKNKKSYKIAAENLNILPVYCVDKEKQLPEFFLLLKNDQLTCVEEDGRIRWHRKIFYKPIWDLYDLPGVRSLKERSFLRSEIEVFLYKGVLIMKDYANIIAMNVSNGSYIWSMADKSKTLDQGKLALFDFNSISKKNDFEKFYLKNLKLYAKFIEDRIIIARGNKIYSLNPATGFCYKSLELDINGVVGIGSLNKLIYVVPYPTDKIIALNKELIIQQVIDLDFTKDKLGFAELAFVKDNILLRFGSDLYIVDKKGKLQDNLNIKYAKRFYIDIYKDNILIILPFKEIACFRLKQGLLKESWKLEPGASTENILWKRYSENSKYYFIVSNQILFPFREECDYFIASIDLQTGKKLWETSLEGAKGFFSNLAGYQECNGMVNFIISTTCNEMCADFNDYCSKSKYAYLNSRLFGLGLSKGHILRNDKLQQQGTDPTLSIDSTLMQTKNYFIYNIYSEFLNVELKKNQ